MDWEEIRKEYEAGGITLQALADKHGVKIGTLKSRKSREGWGKKKDATKKKRDATPEPVILNDDLTDQQQAFCLYYIKCFNATKAYQKAYMCGYDSAMANGNRLIRKDKIKAEIDRLKQEAAQSVMLDATAILQKYIDIAFADIGDFVDFGQRIEMRKEPIGFDSNGNEIYEEVEYNVNYVDFRNSHEIDGTIISEVKRGKDGVSVKLADKMKALDKLTEYVDLMPELMKDKLQQEKIKADTEFVKQRTELIKGTKKDTSLLEALINAKNGDLP